MNKTILEGKWDQFKGKAKQQWGKLTDDDLTQIEGKENELAGKLKERYGYTEEKVQDEIKRFYNSDTSTEGKNI